MNEALPGNGGTRQGVLLILDGLGDRGQAPFDGATPLEAAATPNMDRLIRAGQGGLMDPLFPGVPVGTHTGTGILLGIPPTEVVHLARGPIEAAGIGLEGPEGGLLIRANLATIEATEDGFIILDRRAGRIGEEDARLLTAGLKDLDLGGGIRASLYPATQHRAVLSLRGSGLSAQVSDTDPGNLDGPTPLPPAQPLRHDPNPNATAAAINRFTRIAYQHLKDHPVNLQRQANGLPPANGVLCRSPGMHQQIRSLTRYLKVRSALVAGESTVTGLGRLLGFSVIESPAFTSLPDTDLTAKIAATLTALEDHDLVFLHVKGPDICAHDHDPGGKKALLERIDRAIAPLLDRGLVIGITGDHSTDCNSGRHTGDPVPSLLYAPRGRRDGCRVFGEMTCAGGALGRVSGTGFVCGLLDAMGRLHKFRGAHARYYAPAGAPSRMRG